MPLIIGLGGLFAIAGAYAGATYLFGSAAAKHNASNLLGKIPMIGPWIFSHVDSWFNDVFSGTYVKNWDLVNPWAPEIATRYYPTQTLVRALQAHVQSLLQKFTLLKAAAWTLFLQAIAHTDSQIQALAAYTGGLIHQAEVAAYTNLLGLAAWDTEQLQALAAYTGGLIHQAEADAYTNLLGLAAWDTEQLQALAAYTAETIHQSEVIAYTNLLGLAAWDADQLRALTAYTEGLIAQTRDQAAAEATAAYLGAVSTVNQEAVGTIAGTWPGVADPTRRVLDEVAAEYPGTIPQSVTAPTTIPADLAQVLSAVEAMAIPATIALDECLLPMCRNLGNYGNWLRDLSKILGGGAALGFLAWAIEHPSEAAADAQAIVHDAAAPIVDAVKAVV